ncbi:hypothetical protein L21SP2_2886 [Salinispira pacifica]|uniref:Uncharacterized protein n=1 Tax=Salinispira pacifica TaxID=1307761 RepID=V5WL08_9SPIO|nr:hypothetical protein L21SP2_2886 [Salinispira pacifica]
MKAQSSERMDNAALIVKKPEMRSQFTRRISDIYCNHSAGDQNPEAFLPD